MKLKEFIEGLQKFAKENPDTLEMDVVTSKDDEGNGYNEAYELGTDEYRKHTQEVTPGEPKEVDEASARADAMRAMRKGKEVDPADVDIDASPEDVKGAEKNIIMQLRGVVSLKGIGKVTLTPQQKRNLQKKDSKYLKTLGSGFVDFVKGQEKVDLKVAQAVLNKFNSIQKPADKEKFQSQVGKSYKDMLKVLKAGYNEEVELDEAKPEYEVKYAKSKKGPFKVTKFMTLDQAKEFLADVKKDGMNGIISKGGKPVKEETILERIDRKLKEKKEILEASNKRAGVDISLGLKKWPERWELAGKKFSLINDKGIFILVPQGRPGKEQKLKAKTSQEATQELVKKGYRES